MSWVKYIGLYAAAIVFCAATPVQADKGLHRRSLAQAEPPLSSVVNLEHLTTHATYALRPDRRSGTFGGRVMRSMAHLLRCHHTGMQHVISRRLVEVLYATARHFHSPKLYVIAGYRAPRIAREKGNPKSPHKRGVACDFRLQDVTIEAVRDYLRSKYQNVGVGYYPNSGFIHVDVERKRPAYWIDYSSPGERARYARFETQSSNDRAE